MRREELYYEKRLIAVCIGALLLIQPLVFPASANDTSSGIEKTPRIIGEDTSLRGEYEKHFILEDDDPDAQEMIAVAYSDVVHYQNEEGQWRDIDNTMVPQMDEEGNAILENRDSPFGVELAQSTVQEDLITVDNGERTMSYSIQAAVMPENYVYQRSQGNAPSVLLERKE